MQDASYMENSIYSTADEKPLKERIRLSIEMFSQAH